jgi:ATP-dependent 26S proteasome regulatory subunit
MNDLNDLITLIKSRTPIIVVETVDEMRVIELIRYAAAHLTQDFYYWSIADGMSLANRVIQRESGFRDPTEMLENIYKLKGIGVYLLVDFHPFINEPKNIRLLKEVAINFESRRQTIVLLSQKFELPSELNAYTARFELELPNQELIKKIIIAQVKKWSAQNTGKAVELNDGDIQQMARVLYGLSTSEIERVIIETLRSPVSKNRLANIGRMKFDSFKQTGILTFEQETSKLSQVGGFKKLKEWLQKRQSIFLGEKKVPGLDIPKGILLIGVQGGGKSLAAKAVAGTWGIPLLRLDMGALYDKWAGETERKTRDSLKMAERMSPCVLWIDEIEKGVTTDAGSDSGLSQRVLGTLLTWMAERKESVFVVATANDIQKLPPELMRKGRFDEVFFVDLPDEGMRKEIFSIHLQKRGFDPGKFDLDELSKETNGFAGAEIEQAIVSGLYSMVGGSGNLTNEILITEIRATRPLSVLMAENVAALREWAQGRTVTVN